MPSCGARGGPTPPAFLASPDDALLAQGNLRAGVAGIISIMARKKESGGNALDIGTAFSSFEEALQQLLTEQAQHSVDQALADVGRTSAFQIEHAEVEVSIRGLTVSSRERSLSARAPSPRKRLAKRAAKSRSAATGRPAGPVRAALIAALDQAPEAVTAQSLGEQLKRDGVEATTGNLHQQLGRLVKAGEIERAGRGLYRRRTTG